MLYQEVQLVCQMLQKEKEVFNFQFFEVVVLDLVDFGLMDDFLKKEKEDLESQFFKVEKDLGLLKIIYEDMLIVKIKVEE